MRRALLLGWILALCGLAPLAQALTQPQALSVAQGETDDRIAALGKLVAAPDARTAVLLQALSDERVKLGPDQRVLITTDAGVVDAATGASVTLTPDAQAALEDVMLNNRLRGELDGALAGLRLSSADKAERLAAAKALMEAGGDDARVALLETAITKEQDATVLDALKLARAAALAASPDAAKRLAAAKLLGESHSPETRLLLNQRLSDEQDPEVKRALQRSLRAVEDTLAWGERLGALFTGISLASILLLVALGLAITYGLMGVINMAHGELMMIGAYATYLVQVAFRQWLPGWFDAYLIVAMPAAFLASALVGAALERAVIRWLYGRPLETLLATWGLSLVLMQAVRSLFGAQNVAVESPSWMGGSLALLPGLALPANRLVIIVFALVVLGGMSLLIARTRLGLFVRARHAEPPHRLLHGRAHRARGHLRLRARLGPRGPGRLRAEPGRQRRPGPGPELHRRRLHGGGAGRCRPARRHGAGGARPGPGQQGARRRRRRGAGQDRRAAVHHRLHPEAAAGPVRGQGPRAGVLNAQGSPHDRDLSRFHPTARGLRHRGFRHIADRAGRAAGGTSRRPAAAAAPRPAEPRRLGRRAGRVDHRLRAAAVAEPAACRRAIRCMWTATGSACSASSAATRCARWRWT